MTVNSYQGSASRGSTSSAWASLGRLTIRHEIGHDSGFVGEILALFNPNRINFNGSASVQSRVNAWFESEDPSVELTDYTYQPATLQISLLFDTSEQSGDDGNVLQHTTKMVALLRPLPKMSRPPLCQLWWGRYLLLQGVLTSLAQEYTFFRTDGTPVRATLQCSFTECDEVNVKLARARQARLSRFYIVLLGDTLQSIAHKVYGDVSRWRDIALYNGISNPRAVVPGRLLILPGR